MKRAWLLVTCVGVGVAIGAAVRWLTASDAGFLAVPIAVAIGWFMVANPEECTPRDARPDARARRSLRRPRP